MTMNYRKIISAALCLSLVCSAGCSLGKKSSSTGGGTDYSYSSSKKTTYEFSDFSFELSDDFSVTDKKESADDGSIYRYDFSGGDLTYFSVDNVSLMNCTAEVAAQLLYDDITEDVSDAELEKLDIPGMSAALVHYRNESSEKDTVQGESVLYISTEAHFFTAEIGYEDPDDRGKVGGLLRDLANSVKFTSSDRLPTEPQTYDDEWITLKYAPEWAAKETNGSRNDPDMLELRVSYAYATDAEHYLYPRLSINVEPEDDERDPKSIADRAYDSKKEYYKDVTRSTDEIFGYKAETLRFTLTSGTGSICKYYFFSDNGYTYTIGYSVHEDAEKMNTDEINELLKGLTIKKFTPEQLEKQKQERETAAYQEIEFCGAKYTLDSRFELQLDRDDEKVFHHKNNDMYITMSCHDSYGADIEEYMSNKALEIRYFNDLDKMYSHREIFGRNTFEVIDYVSKADTEANGETSKCSVYFYEHGGKVFEYTIGYTEKNEETATKYIANMLSSMSFE